MKITEARIKLMPSRSDRLQAFCTITIDDEFVIRDIKIIEGAKGAFVAMPSRKLTDKCVRCSGKNHLRSRFCNDCGAKLDENRATKDKRGRAKLHADVAHPINSACRERLQATIIEEYEKEVARSREPGYVPARLYDDEDMDEDLEEHEHEEEEAPPQHAPERKPPEEKRPELKPVEKPVVAPPTPAPAPKPAAPAPTPPAPAPPTPKPAPKPPAPSYDDLDEDLKKPLAESLKELEEAQKEDEEDEEEDVDEDDTRGNDFAAGIL